MRADTPFEHGSLAPRGKPLYPNRRNIDIDNLNFERQIAGGAHFVGNIHLNVIFTDVSGHCRAAEGFGFFVENQPIRQRAVIFKTCFDGGFADKIHLIENSFGNRNFYPLAAFQRYVGHQTGRRKVHRRTLGRNPQQIRTVIRQKFALTPFFQNAAEINRNLRGLFG